MSGWLETLPKQLAKIRRRERRHAAWVKLQLPMLLLAVAVMLSWLFYGHERALFIGALCAVIILWGWHRNR